MKTYLVGILITVQADDGGHAIEQLVNHVLCHPDENPFSEVEAAVNVLEEQEPSP